MAKPITITDPKNYKRTKSVVITDYQAEFLKEKYGTLTNAIMTAHKIAELKQKQKARKNTMSIH